MHRTPLPSVKIGEGAPNPIFNEGRGGSVQRLDNKCPELILRAQSANCLTLFDFQKNASVQK